MDMAEEARKWRLSIGVPSKVVDSNVRKLCNLSITSLAHAFGVLVLPEIMPLNVDMCKASGVIVDLGTSRYCEEVLDRFENQ
jgi:hypothetical protein